MMARVRGVGPSQCMDDGHGVKHGPTTEDNVETVWRLAHWKGGKSGAKKAPRYFYNQVGKAYGLCHPNSEKASPDVRRERQVGIWKGAEPPGWGGFGRQPSEPRAAIPRGWKRAGKEKGRGLALPTRPRSDWPALRERFRLTASGSCWPAGSLASRHAPSPPERRTRCSA